MNSHFHLIFSLIICTSSFILASPVPEHVEFQNLGTFKYMTRNGQMVESTYHLSTGRAYWDTVVAACVENGLGKLLSIESAAEDQIIKELVKRETYSIWVSGTFEDGTWRWASTGQSIEGGYTNWRTAPTQNPYHRVYVATNQQDGSYGWFTYSGSVSKKYICEQTTQL